MENNEQDKSNNNGLSCPKCNSNDILPVSQIKGKTQGFGLGKAAVGGLVLGPIGLAAGAIGMGKGKTKSEVVWVCKNCGNQFSAKKAITSKRNKENNMKVTDFIKKHPFITFGIALLVIIISIIGNCKEKATVNENKTVSVESSNVENLSSNYKLVNNKLGKHGAFYQIVHIYVANDRNYQKMYDFAVVEAKKASNSDTIFRAVFFDNETFAVLPVGEVQSEYWEDDNLKHMIAKYTKNFVNGFEGFVYWENNAYESPSKTLK